MSTAGMTVSVVCAFVVAINVGAQSLTLRELARRSAPQPVWVERSREFVIVPLADVVMGADLIVYGSVTTRATYLSAGEHDLYTEYTVSPMRILSASRSPITRPIIVKRWGGDIILDGLEVHVVDRQLRPFRDGETVILFLEQGDDGKYALVGQVSGAASVSDGRVFAKPDSMLHLGAASGLTVNEFEAHIRQLRQQ